MFWENTSPEGLRTAVVHALFPCGLTLEWKVLPSDGGQAQLLCPSQALLHTVLKTVR